MGKGPLMSEDLAMCSETTLRRSRQAGATGPSAHVEVARVTLVVMTYHPTLLLTALPHVLQQPHIQGWM